MKPRQFSGVLGLVIAPFWVAAAGCSLGDRLALHLDHREARMEMREDRQELREELHRLELEQRSLAAEQEVAVQREKISQSRQCLPETAPLVESTLALPLQQQYVVSAPEVDLAELRERMKLEEQDHEQRMNEWRQQYSAWRERARLHEKQDQARRDLARRNFSQKAPCGCQAALAAGECCCPPHHRGHCGCLKALHHGRCCCESCEQTCEYADLKRQPFTEPPPEMPLQSLPLSELPVKMRLQIRHDIGRAKITELSTRRAPLEQPPGKQPCDQPCDAAPHCTDKPKVGQAPIYSAPTYAAPVTSASDGGGYVGAPPHPEPDEDPRTSHRPPAPTPKPLPPQPTTYQGTHLLPPPGFTGAAGPGFASLPEIATPPGFAPPALLPRSPSPGGALISPRPAPGLAAVVGG